MNKAKEKLEERFDEIIREKISTNVFRRYTSGWQDKDLVCDTMEGWDFETKKEALTELDEHVNEEFEMKKTFEDVESTLASMSEKDVEDIMYLRDCVKAIKEYTFLG